MSYIRIGDEQRNISDIDEHWLNEQLRRRRGAGGNTCIQVSLKTSSIDILLSTPECASGGGGGRPPTAQEKLLFEEWAKRGLNGTGYSPGDIVSFLQQVRRNGIT
jgi:hypothetical protein